MAQLPPVKVPLNEWIDIYAETGIPAGTQVIIHNNGDNLAILSDSLTEPLPGSGYDNIKPNEFLTSTTTPDGVWVLSSRGTVLQVSEVV